MAHFERPATGKIDAEYDIDSKMALGSVWRLQISPNGSAEIALYGGNGLAVRSNNQNVVKNPLPEQTRGGRRVFLIQPVGKGTTMIEMGMSNAGGLSWAPGSPWPGSLQIRVEEGAGAVSVPDGLVRLNEPSIALNSSDTPYPYRMMFSQNIKSGTPARDIINSVKEKGRLKHLVFSCHGRILYNDNGVTDSIIDIGTGLDKSNVDLFTELQTMSGGVIWAGACGIGNDNQNGILRAKNSQCYFVAPVMYMQIKPGSRPLGKGLIDMYKRFGIKVFTPQGGLVDWNTFVREQGKRLGIEIVKGTAP